MTENEISQNPESNQQDVLAQVSDLLEEIDKNQVDKNPDILDQASQVISNVDATADITEIIENKFQQVMKDVRKIAEQEIKQNESGMLEHLEKLNQGELSEENYDPRNISNRHKAIGKLVKDLDQYNLEKASVSTNEKYERMKQLLKQAQAIVGQ